MKNRLMTSLAVVLVLALAFVLKVYVSSYFFDALILTVAVFCAYEMSKILTKMGKYHEKWIVYVFPALIALVNLLSAGFDKEFSIIWAILVDVLLIGLAFLVEFLIGIIFKNKTAKEMRFRRVQGSVNTFSLQKAFNTMIGLIYPSFMFMAMIFLNHIDDFSSTFSKVGEYGGHLSFVILLFAFLIPIFSDTFAFLTGGLIGGKKLCPKISPKKTISGAVGGVVWTVLLSVCVFFILNSVESLYIVFNETGFAFWQVLLISFFGSIVSQCGDLFESLLKRQADVKDSGRILPGHGGMLDRCDSYVFVAPYLLLAVVFILL